MRNEIIFDADDWGVVRLAELLEDDEDGAELHVVLAGNTIVDVYIRREDGSTEREDDDDGPRPEMLSPLPLAPSGEKTFNACVRVHFQPRRLILTGPLDSDLEDRKVVSVRIESGERKVPAELLAEPTPANRFGAAFGSPLLSGEPMQPGETLVVELDEPVQPFVNAMVLGIAIPQTVVE